MITITTSKILDANKNEIFSLVENVQKLSQIKSDIKEYSIRRDEPGLQIIDVTIKFPFFIKKSVRLKYTTLLEKYTELKLIKGSLKEYTCSYSLKDSGPHTEVVISVSVRFRNLLFDALISSLIKPFLSWRLRKELRNLENLLTAAYVDYV